MRILFLYPNINTRNGLHYPHGVGALAAVCAHAGHEPAVRLLERMPTRDQWLADLESVSPDLLVCGFGSNQWRYAAYLMDWTRRAGCPVLAGATVVGAAATSSTSTRPATTSQAPGWSAELSAVGTRVT